MYIRITCNVIFELSELNFNVASFLEIDEMQCVLYRELYCFLFIVDF